MGNTILIGRGAGQDATASAVISDVVDAVESILNGDSAALLRQEQAFYNRISDGSSIASLDEIEGSYYLRLSVQDKPGVLAKVTDILANGQISISTVEQSTNPESDSANLILTTHKTTEKAMADAVKSLSRESSVLHKPVLMRIFEKPE